jgi:histidinol phosphatase-like enzyme
MVLWGVADFNIDLKKSYTIGDSIKDYLLGFNMSGKGIFVLTGHGRKQQSNLVKEKVELFVVQNLKTIRGLTQEGNVDEVCTGRFNGVMLY